MRGYVIISPSPRESFRSAASRAGLSLAVSFSAEGVNPYQEAWSNANRSVVLQYVEETNLGIEYFFLKGDATLRAHIMSNLVQDLTYFSREQIVAAAGQASSPDDRVRSSNWLAVAETDFDTEVFELLSRFTADADEVVRTAATRALGYLRWQEARSILERLAASDASEWVRNAARLGLGDLG